jgi:hypothetical protein
LFGSVAGANLLLIICNFFTISANVIMIRRNRRRSYRHGKRAKEQD